MCGSAGYSLKVDARIDRTLAAQALLAGIAERGADAVGYAHRSSGEAVSVHKQRSGASAFLPELTVPASSMEVLLHERDYTKGHPTIEANNHPVRHGNIVGVHNWIILNDEEIFEGHSIERYVSSMRELLGLIGAHEWRKKGIEIPAAGGRIHPHYGVFAPVRNEYVALVAEAPLPSTSLAFDIGTGTSVLAAVLARRGVERVVASEQDARALRCARDNLARLGLADKVEVVETDLFPDGKAPLIVCNPPWIPGRATSPRRNGKNVMSPTAIAEIARIRRIEMVAIGFSKKA